MAWIIKYHNVSSKTLTLSDFNGITQAIVGEINHEPDKTLESGGEDYLSLDQNALKFISDGGIDIYQGINMPTKTLWIRMHVPVQVFGIGTSPYWYYLINNGENPTLDNSSWKEHDSDTIDTTINDLKIKMSPVKDHTSITLDIIIDDIKTK